MQGRESASKSNIRLSLGGPEPLVASSAEWGAKWLWSWQLPEAK